MADEVLTVVLADTEVVTVALDGEVETVTIVEHGPQGPAGPSPLAALYQAAQVSPVAGVLTIDLAAGSHFLVNMDQNVTSVVFQGAPAADKAQGLFLYFKQDGTGGRTIAATAWPAGRHAPAAVAPALSVAADAIDIIVVNAALAAFGIIAITQVAANYRPF